MHPQVEISGGALMPGGHAEGAKLPAGPALTRGHLQMVVPGGRLWFDRAIAAGCIVIVPFAPHSPGAMNGDMVKTRPAFFGAC